MIEVKQGDIVIVHAPHFLARVIQFFMNLSRWLRLDFKPIYKSVGNHTAVGLGSNIVVEATKHGVEFRDVNKAYPAGSGVKIKVYRYDMSFDQLVTVTNLATRLKNIPYQFDNLLIYPIYIITFGLVWIGRKATYALNKIYCSELTGIILYYTTVPIYWHQEKDEHTHYYFRTFWKTSPHRVERWCEKNCTLIATYEL
jgi:hypothetical protein